MRLRKYPLLLLLFMLLSAEVRRRKIVLFVMNQVPRQEETEQIWRELSDRLRQFVRARVNSTNDVDDILQNVFLRIHSHFDQLRQSDRLEAWVFQITRNVVTDYFRKQRGESDSIDLVEAPETTSIQTADAELSGCLSSLIGRLQDEQRRALSMYELEGISQKEIAARESISLSGAKSRIQRGRKSLEAMLRACCEFQFDRRGNVLEYEPTDAGCDCDQGSCE